MGVMDMTRFTALADAFGGRIERWPEAERDAAWRFLADEGEAARAVLAEGLELDEALEVLRPPQPSAGLREAILAAAPKSRPARSPLWRWLTGAGLGAGLAAACAAGVLAGVQTAGPSSDDARADALIASSYDGGTLGLTTDGENNS